MQTKKTYGCQEYRLLPKAKIKIPEKNIIPKLETLTNIIHQIAKHLSKKCAKF